jgi:dTMP kinase
LALILFDPVILSKLFHAALTSRLTPEVPMPRAAFISLDGLDGTGKSTQCRMLAEWLGARHVPVTSCTDPGGTALGLELRKLLLFGRQHRIGTTTEAMLFMASRAQLVEEVIRPALGRGEVVVSDRFLLANVVYQGHAGGLYPDDLWAVGRVATGGLEPDLTLVLDLPPEAAVARRNREADRMEDRGAAYFARVRAGFMLEANRRPDAHHVIDATPDADAVQAAIRREVANLLNDRGWDIEA